MAPCIFQDDIARLAENLESVKHGNDKIEEMAEEKLLDFNFDKSCYLLIGKKKFQNKINNQLSQKPIMFCGQQMKMVKSERYLGDYIGHSLAESVFITVQKRKGLCKRLISEIKVTLKDCRINVIGGLTTGLEIWNLAVIPYLLGNAECWMEIPKKAINVLNSIQNDFLRSLFQTGNGTPISALYWDTGSLMIENQIMQRKLLFLYHLMTLPENSLAKEIYLIQKENALPGLVNECEQFLSDLNIHADPSTFTKGQWKKIIRKKIQDRNKQLLLQQIREYKKT